VADVVDERTVEVERFESLYAENAVAVLGYFRRRMSDQAEVADAVAEVFTTAWRRIQDVPSGNDGRLWLFGIARFVLLNERRGNRRRRALASRLSDELATKTQYVQAPTSSARALVEAMGRLRPDDRELLMLTAWDGLSPADAAVVLELDPGVVRVRLHRARTRLRDELEETKVVVKRRDTGGHVMPQSATVALSEQGSTDRG
jgi:RNA polymerase sigma factor (sigma-70 family)